MESRLSNRVEGQGSLQRGSVGRVGIASRPVGRLALMAHGLRLVRVSCIFPARGGGDSAATWQFLQNLPRRAVMRMTAPKGPRRLSIGILAGLSLSLVMLPAWATDRKSTRLNSSHIPLSRMP